MGGICNRKAIMGVIFNRKSIMGVWGMMKWDPTLPRDPQVPMNLDDLVNYKCRGTGGRKAPRLGRVSHQSIMREDQV